MSRLDELIKELCPDGVEYKPLWSVTVWDKKFNAVDKSKQSRIISYNYLLASELFKLEVENGDVFLLSTGEQTGWTTEELAGDNLKEGEVVTIPWGKSRSVTDCIKYYKGKFVTADNRIMTSFDVSVLNNKYLYYWVMTQGKVIDTFYRGSGIKHPDMAKVLDLKIPVPPLEVQAEIVRILDTFTELTAELQAKLEAELTARKKQYEYYRDELLSFGGGHSTSLDKLVAKFCPNGIEYKTLGEIAYYAKNRMPVSCVDEHTYVGVDNLLQNKMGKTVANSVPSTGSVIAFSSGDVLIGNIRPYLRKIWLSDCDGGTNGDVLAISIIDRANVLPKYLYHILSSEDFFNYDNQNSKGAKMPRGDKKAVMNYIVPVPPLEIQQEIACILDRFDKLCNDLYSGLPAEIVARQKQYEYYRDKLLTFKEKECNLL